YIRARYLGEIDGHVIGEHVGQFFVLGIAACVRKRQCDNRRPTRLDRLDGLKERRSVPPNERNRTGGDQQDGGRGGRVHPPVSDNPARCLCRRGHNWRRCQSFRQSRRRRSDLGVVPRIRQTVLAFSATSGYAERKSIAATRYVLNAALAVA